MKFKVQAATILEDGKHEGIIEKIEYREEPYAYTDIYIAVTGKENAIAKVGYPSFLSPTTGLGKLLERMGSKLEIGKEVDPEDCLIGKSVSFITINEEKNGKTYTKVLGDSVKSAHTITKEK